LSWAPSATAAVDPPAAPEEEPSAAGAARRHAVSASPRVARAAGRSGAKATEPCTEGRAGSSPFLRAERDEPHQLPRAQRPVDGGESTKPSVGVSATGGARGATGRGSPERASGPGPEGLAHDRGVLHLPRGLEQDLARRELGRRIPGTGVLREALDRLESRRAARLVEGREEDRRARGRRSPLELGLFDEPHLREDGADGAPPETDFTRARSRSACLTSAVANEDVAEGAPPPVAPAVDDVALAEASPSPLATAVEVELARAAFHRTPGAAVEIRAADRRSGLVIVTGPRL